uniref:SET domain-containing protein n=1 Tax=Caenorhabditis tropicalis TaxID=1561998 RepID=A0A1I7TJQ5_9PELO
MPQQKRQARKCHVMILPLKSELNDAHEDDQRNWPETAFFETIAENVPGKNLQRSMETAIRLGKLPQNRVGTAVASFNGEFSSHSSTVGKIDDKYTLQLTDTVEKKMGRFIEELDLSNGYKGALKRAFRCSTVVNPLRKGNFARFFSHSCDPNLTLIRVFSGGIAPSNIRIVFVANRDVEEGEELTFNYGEQYKKQNLGDNCLCKKCTQAKDKKKAKAGEQKQTTSTATSERVRKSVNDDGPSSRERRYAARNAVKEEPIQFNCVLRIEEDALSDFVKNGNFQSGSVFVLDENNAIISAENPQAPIQRTLKRPSSNTTVSNQREEEVPRRVRQPRLIFTPTPVVTVARRRQQDVESRPTRFSPRTNKMATRSSTRKL